MPGLLVEVRTHCFIAMFVESFVASICPRVDLSESHNVILFFVYHQHSADPDLEAARTKKPKRPSANTAAGTETIPPSNPAAAAAVSNALHVAAAAMTVERCESPLRSLQLATAATATSGGSVYRKDREDVSPSRNDSFMVSSATSCVVLDLQACLLWSRACF